MVFRSAIAFAALLYGLLAASPGHAVTTVYVSGTGSGGCTSPATACSSLADALQVAQAGDTIVCLSPPVPAPLSIIISVTIDCSSARAPFANSHNSMTVGDGSAVHILIAAGSGVVRLRGLDIDSGADRGIDIQSAAAVFIEDCVISNNNKQGIYDHRIGGQTKLFVKNTVFSGNAAGIVAVSAAVGITVLDNVTSERSGYGIAVGNGNNVEIKNSVFSGNSVAGVEGDAGSHIVVSGSTISHNNIGVQSAMSVRIYNNSMSYNNTAFSGPAATLGLNRYNQNVSIGTTPGIVPNAPVDIGP